jgi:hypothetical protein
MRGRRSWPRLKLLETLTLPLVLTLEMQLPWSCHGVWRLSREEAIGWRKLWGDNGLEGKPGFHHPGPPSPLLISRSPTMTCPLIIFETMASAMTYPREQPSHPEQPLERIYEHHDPKKSAKNEPCFGSK